MNRNFLPGDIIGYRKNGAPIRLIAGGSSEHVETETPENTPPASPAGPFYTQADIERARQEEKDKLYDRLNKQATRLNSMESQLKQWTEQQEAAAKAAEQQATAEAEAARQRAEAEMDAKQLLLQRDKEWQEERERFNQRFAQLEAEREQERAILEKDRQFAQLQAYIQRRVSEESGEIAPELIDLITGNTPEEVEASISRMKEKTSLILNGVSEAQTALASQMRGVSPSGYGAYGPMESQSGTKSYTAEELASMPMSEYQQVRPQLLGGSASGNGRGIFG